MGRSTEELLEEQKLINQALDSQFIQATVDNGKLRQRIKDLTALLDWCVNTQNFLAETINKGLQHDEQPSRASQQINETSPGV